LRERSIERAMDLTHSFTCKVLPTRDADTGHLTAAGWIPLTMKYNRSAPIAVLCIYTVQSTIRIVTNHETIFIAWYPFDWTVSPFYELVNISQVTRSITESCSIYSYCILNSTHCVYWRTSFFFLSHFLYYFFKNLCYYRALNAWLTKRNWKNFQWVSFDLTVALRWNFSAELREGMKTLVINGFSAGTQRTQINSTI